MPSFFDLQKFAATGIASADMTAYDKARALAAFGGVKTQTLTGVPPLSFKSNGSPLISWSMLGNGQQTGTPSPQNIIMPTFCGVRTANLYAFPYSSTLSASGTGQNRTVNNTQFLKSSIFQLEPDTTYTFSGKRSGANDRYGRLFLFTEKPDVGSVSTHFYSFPGDSSVTFTTDSTEKWCLAQTDNTAPEELTTNYQMMLNSGSTALPYEPYGWAEKITNAGQTTTVYLGQTQTVRRVMKFVLTGEENWQKYVQTSTSWLYYISLGSQNKSASISALCTHAQYSARVPNEATVGVRISDPFTALLLNLGAVIGDNSADDFKAYLAQQYAAGTPVTVWYVLATPETGIVNEPLCKIGDYADELHSEDAGVTIPTVKGQNVLTVDTELQPSSMTITYFEEV